MGLVLVVEMYRSAKMHKGKSIGKSMVKRCFGRVLKRST